MTKFREYKEDSPQEKLYLNMYKNQTFELVKGKINKYNKLDNCKLSMKEALKTMNDFVDPSDPDIDLSNLVHAYQTAESIREKYPHDKEFQICGLIHDVGKILFKFGEPNWSIVGDTFVLGACFPKSVVYHKYICYSENNNYDKLGIYAENCGIENLTLSFGHDEYLYQVLSRNQNHKLSARYLNMIRYHSFYPWHNCGEYTYFMNGDQDESILKDVQLFNQFDLYSKHDEDTTSQDIIDYYDKLLDEYFPEELSW